MDERTPMCKWPGCKPLPAMAEKTLLATDKTFLVCRKHKAEINQLNAEYIHDCQWNETINGMRDKRCYLLAVAMVNVADDEYALCRKHRSVINDMYARSRVR